MDTFRDTFQSGYSEVKEYNGKRYTIIRKANELDIELFGRETIVEECFIIEIEGDYLIANKFEIMD